MVVNKSFYSANVISNMFSCLTAWQLTVAAEVRSVDDVTDSYALIYQQATKHNVLGVKSRFTFHGLK